MRDSASCRRSAYRRARAGRRRAGPCAQASAGWRRSSRMQRTCIVIEPHALLAAHVEVHPRLRRLLSLAEPQRLTHRRTPQRSCVRPAPRRAGLHQRERAAPALLALGSRTGRRRGAAPARQRAAHSRAHRARCWWKERCGFAGDECGTAWPRRGNLFATRYTHTDKKRCAFIRLAVLHARCDRRWAPRPSSAAARSAGRRTGATATRRLQSARRHATGTPRAGRSR